VVAQSNLSRPLRFERVGLALAGGAARGAYQIGCWKALREAGIARFAAISGTSVGALNACLIAGGDIELASKLWVELAPDQILFNPGGEKRLRALGGATIALAALLVPFNFSWRAARDTAALFLSRRWHIGSNRPLSRLIRQYVRLERLRASGAKVFCTESLFDGYYDPYEPLWIENIMRPIGSVGGQLIGEMELDPEQMQWPTVGWMPHVTELTNLRSDNEVVFSLLRSANVPILFRKRAFRGRRSSDGGIAERAAPLYPLVKEGCDLIVSISLEPLAQVPTQQELRALIEREYLRRDVLPGSKKDAQQLYRQFCEAGFPEKPKSPYSVTGREFLFIAPSRPLGNAFNFTGGARARELIELGYQDTESALTIAS
jgi:predicted acylesterase/phospholipase RssA